MRYRLISFDFDGTLADSSGWFFKTLNELAAEFHFKALAPEERDLVRGWDTRKIMQHLGVPLWKLPAIMSRVRGLASRDRHLISLFPGVEEMLAGLRSHGVMTAIVSSNSEKTIREVLGPDTARLVERYVCGASLFAKASKLRGLLRASRTAAADAIYIGDETRDAEAAREAQLDFGAVSWGYATPEALRKYAPERVFQEVGDILSLLDAS